MNTNQEVETSVEAVTPQKRDSLGLFPNVSYKFNDDGSINWRAMVKSEHLFPNKGWFEIRNKPVPQSIEGLADYQLLIKLGGIKELAKLRGFKSVKYEIVKCETNYVSIKCGITWIPNYEADYEIHYEDVANATNDNTSNFAVKFLETIAANRAFVRAVRNFLNIHIVGSDEIDSSKKNASSSVVEEEAEFNLPSSQNMLEKIAKSAGMAFPEFQTFVENARIHNIYNNKNSSKWTSFDDVPAKDARILISILKDK